MVASTPQSPPETGSPQVSACVREAFAGCSSQDPLALFAPASSPHSGQVDSHAAR